MSVVSKLLSYCARHCFPLESILHVYKSIFRQCFEYRCHIWSGTLAIYLNVLDEMIFVLTCYPIVRQLSVPFR